MNDVITHSLRCNEAEFSVKIPSIMVFYTTCGIRDSSEHAI